MHECILDPRSSRLTIRIKNGARDMWLKLNSAYSIILLLGIGVQALRFACLSQ